MKGLLRDYVHAVRYAFTLPWRATRDVGLHHQVLASLFGLICGALIGPVAVVVDGKPWDLLWCALFFVFGLANAAYLIHRYRRRNDPELLETWLAAKVKGTDSRDDTTGLGA